VNQQKQVKKNNIPIPKGVEGDAREEENSEFVVRLVSLSDKNGIENIDDIVPSFMSKGFRTDYFEYKSIVKKTYKKPINPKFPDGPKEKVTVEEKENVNTSLKLIRQLDWRATKDPENVLNVQITRTKGESCSVPLVFAKIFEKKRNILVTGATKDLYDQLTSKPDLKFQSIPAPIEANEGLKEELIKRSKRTRGMQSTARELLEFKGLPKKISDMITAMSMGRRVDMSDTEAINLILLSDLMTRYNEVLKNFQQEILDRSSTVSTLSNQFLLLASKIRPAFLVAKTKDLFEEPITARTNAEFFALFYSRIQLLDAEKKRENDNKILFNNIFAELRSLIIMVRSFQDADNWSKCQFYLKSEDGSNVEPNNQKTITTITDAIREYIVKKQGQQSRSLEETYLTYNIHRFFKTNRVWIDNNVPATDAGIMESVLFPRLDIRMGKFNVKDDSLINLFEDQAIKRHQLHYSLPLLSKAYGYLFSCYLKELLSNFVKGGLRHFTKRFGEHLFNALFERVVMKPGLPIGRNQFAPWLKEQKILVRPEEYGFIKSDIETRFDQRLTNKILCGSGEPIITDEISPKEFAQEFQNAQKSFLGFIEEVRSKELKSKSALHPGTIFLKRIEEKRYDFTSADFRKSLREEELVTNLTQIVTKACNQIRQEIQKVAVYQKVIFQLPYKYEPLLQIAHTFDVQIGAETFSVHLVAVPVESANELKGLSKNFAGNFSTALKNSGTSNLSYLLETGKILDKYREVSEPFFWFLSMVVIDRYLHQISSRESKGSNRSAAHIKYFYSDEEKAVIGNVIDRSLKKILQHDSNPKKAGGDLGVEHFTYGHILQTIMAQKSVLVELENLREVLKIVLHLLGKFAEKVKQGSEWQQYNSTAKRFFQLISLPVAGLDSQTLLALKGLSRKLKDIVDMSEGQNSVVSTLHAQFQKRNPAISRQIYFYEIFLDEKDTVGNNMLHRLRNVQELMRLLKTKKCIIFFPERSKESQLKQIGDILDFFSSESFNANMFVETAILDRDHTEALCRYFSPKAFFRLNRLEPVPRPKAVAAN